MSKKGNKKNYKVIEANLDIEVILDTRIETMFGDTNEVTEISSEFKWGELYQIIRGHDVLDIGLKEMVLYQNIKSFGITEDATFLELFTCL